MLAWIFAASSQLTFCRQSGVTTIEIGYAAIALAFPQTELGLPPECASFSLSLLLLRRERRRRERIEREMAKYVRQRFGGQDR